jgi:hypothetical protein
MLQYIVFVSLSPFPFHLLILIQFLVHHQSELWGNFHKYCINIFTNIFNNKWIHTNTNNNTDDKIYLAETESNITNFNDVRPLKWQLFHIPIYLSKIWRLTFFLPVLDHERYINDENNQEKTKLLIKNTTIKSNCLFVGPHIFFTYFITLILLFNCFFLCVYSRNNWWLFFGFHLRC